jgi:carboxylesterase
LYKRLFKKQQLGKTELLRLFFSKEACILIGCLCLHGFTGAPYEVQPLAEYLKEHTDWKIVVPTLPGHGEELQLKGVTYHDWLQHADEELTRLKEECDHVYLIGFSMGGLIAAYLATKYDVQKLVLLSAAAYYINPSQLKEDVLMMVKDSVRGKLHENELFHRYKKKIVATPLSATIEFRKLVKFVRPKLRHVTIPTLIAQGECDGIVPVKSAQYLYERIGAPKKILFYSKKANHHICHSEDCEELFQAVLNFLRESM